MIPACSSLLHFIGNKYKLIEALFKFCKGCNNIFGNALGYNKFDTVDFCVVNFLALQ